MRYPAHLVFALTTLMGQQLAYADNARHPPAGAITPKEVDLATETFSRWVDASGNIKLPENYRQDWGHAGSWIVADPKAPGHGFHDVYLQKQAAKTYRETGKFPDGTVLVKEVRQVKAGAQTTGHAQWAGDTNVWFVMVKDSQGRFANSPHWKEGWGWGLYEAKNPKLNVSKSFAETCMACHTPAKKTDWVFINGYPSLKK